MHYFRLISMLHTSIGLILLLQVINFAWGTPLNSSITSTELSSSSPNLRQSRTIMGKELNMTNLPSCMSRILCRMKDADSAESGENKNVDLLKKLMKSLMKRHHDDDGSSEESEYDNFDSINEVPQKPSKTAYRIIKPSYKSYKSDSLEKLVNEYDGIFSRRNGSPLKKRVSSHRTSKLFGLFKPTKMRRKTPINPAHLQELKTALQNPTPSSNSRQCNSRLLKLTLIRNNYPPTTFPTRISPSPTSPESCPFNFGELQKMLLDTFGALLMTAGGLGGAIGMLPMSQPPPTKDQPMKIMEMGSQPFMTPQNASLYGNQNPHTVYANFKLPITISSEPGDQGSNIHSYHQTRPSYQKIKTTQTKSPNLKPISALNFPNFFKRRGNSKTKFRKPLLNQTFAKDSEEASNSEESGEKKAQNLNIYNIQKIESNNIPFRKISSDFFGSFYKTMLHFQYKLIDKLQQTRNKPAPMRRKMYNPFQRRRMTMHHGKPYRLRQLRQQHKNYDSASLEHSDEEDD